MAIPPTRRRLVMDGPFAETKELVVGSWPDSAGRYASVNGLDMYYEVHGRGRPLVLLHAALTTIDRSFGHVLTTLAATRQVIAIEQQAHGRTADIDRPLTCEQMADDTAELCRQLGLEQADFFGFSMGGAVALQLAVQYPRLPRRMALVSSHVTAEGGCTPELWEVLRTVESSEEAAVLRRDFQRVGGAERWPAAVTRVREAFERDRGIAEDRLRRIEAPTLFITGEESMFGRQPSAELASIVPNARLEVFPGDDHDPSVITRSAALLPAFLDGA
jgi:pimeloyl-ACP methyl ester carboxylesterase